MDASAELHLIAGRLRAAGERDIRLGLTRTLRAQALPVKRHVQEAALRVMPKGGGLAQREADAVKVQVLTSARSAGVRISNRKLGASQLESGYVRHPVFGNRKRWSAEQVRGARRWFAIACAEETPKVAAELTATIRATSARIQGL